LSRNADVDVIVVARGGGSLEDLWPFNEERVARAIARSSKPVISAVGHEVDFTIADFVADLRAPTPSAAAEIVSQSKEELFRQVEQLDRRLKAVVRYRLSNVRGFLASKVGSRGFAVAEAQLKRLAQRVDDFGLRLERFGRDGGFLKSRAHRVEVCAHQLEASIRKRLRRAHDAFGRAAHTLDALSPLAVLERGYAVCRTAEGQLVRDAARVPVDSAVTVRVHQGSLVARVLSTEPGE
jgi:exodeoxyribonuclease VII large subunit